MIYDYLLTIFISFCYLVTFKFSKLEKPIKLKTQFTTLPRLLKASVYKWRWKFEEGRWNNQKAAAGIHVQKDSSWRCWHFLQRIPRQRHHCRLGRSIPRNFNHCWGSQRIQVNNKKLTKLFTIKLILVLENNRFFLKCILTFIIFLKHYLMNL